MTKNKDNGTVFTPEPITIKHQDSPLLVWLRASRGDVMQLKATAHKGGDDERIANLMAKMHLKGLPYTH